MKIITVAHCETPPVNFLAVRFGVVVFDANQDVKVVERKPSTTITNENRPKSLVPELHSWGHDIPAGCFSRIVITEVGDMLYDGFDMPINRLKRYDLSRVAESAIIVILKGKARC